MGTKVIGFNFKSEKHKMAAAILLDRTVVSFEKSDNGTDFEQGSLIARELAEHEAVDALTNPVFVETPTFESELKSLINKYSKGNTSNTPDYILIAYSVGCLKSWELTINERDKHFGANFDPENNQSTTLINE